MGSVQVHWVYQEKQLMYSPASHKQQVLKQRELVVCCQCGASRCAVTRNQVVFCGSSGTHKQPPHLSPLVRGLYPGLWPIPSSMCTVQCLCGARLLAAFELQSAFGAAAGHS